MDYDGATKTAQEIIKMGCKSKAYKIDVTNANDIMNLRDQMTKELGMVDIVVNNAGMIAATNLEDAPTRIEMMVKVNLLGPLLVSFEEISKNL